MLTRQNSYAILAFTVVCAILYTSVGLPSAMAADLSLGFGGQGVYPYVATANSQRWFRVHVTYDGTINSDGVANERIRGLYLDQGVSYNNNPSLPAAPSGYTYQQELASPSSAPPAPPHTQGIYGAGRATGDQPEYFGVAPYTVAGYPDYEYVFTVGPFAGHHYDYLVGRVYTGHESPSETHDFRFTLYWDAWDSTSGSYVAQTPVQVSGTYITLPVPLPWWLSSHAGVSEVQDSFEQPAWYSGDVGAGVDPLVVTEGEEGTNIDNGSGSANYTFRLAYNSQRSDLPPVWRVTPDRTMPGENYPYVRFDSYVEEGLRNDNWTDYWRKWSYWDIYYYPHSWIYWDGDDPHRDWLGTQHSLRNPEAVLILDDNYDRPFYMERESGSFAGTVVYRYDIRPTNYLQLLNNIFLFPFDPAGPDAWDAAANGHNGIPYSNAYAAMRAGGHKYEFITTRDWDPPIWAVNHLGPGNTHAQVGPCSVALASRPGDSLTAQHVLRDSTNAGTIADPEVVYEDLYQWFDDQGGGGYGYPYDSQLADRYPKVDPVLTAFPYFEEGPLTGPNSVERGYPWRGSLESGIGPRMAGALPNPFNPDGNTGEPWGPLVGPKYPQISNPSSAPVNVYGGYNPGSPLNPNATGESPERFTNQDTIWPNYVNIWGDIPYDPDLSQPSGFRGGKWTTTTNFVFRINYWQSDNLAPGSIQLFVRKVGEDGSPLTGWMGYSMSKVYPADNIYTDGCLYYEAEGRAIISTISGPVTACVQQSIRTGLRMISGRLGFLPVTTTTTGSASTTLRRLVTSH